MTVRTMLGACCMLVAQFSIPAWAEQNGRGQSIMFGDDQRALTEQPTKADELTERCKNLSRKVEALKGKPQRRYAAAQRYEAECGSSRRGSGAN